MSIPVQFKDRLRLPVIGAPMFLASGMELVIAQCCNGIIGTFPTLNARPAGQLEHWLETIQSALDQHDRTHPQQASAPFGVNLILHRSNDRRQADLAIVVKHKVPFVITSVGKPDEVVQKVHEYGGLVFHDVVSIEHAKKAVECGVDGLILVCAGAGGHGGTLSPFAFVREVRQFWSGPIALAGALSDGASVRAAEVLGADFAYMGTRFIATQESDADSGHKQMIVADGSGDIFYTPVFSGISANYLSNSILASGIDLVQLGDAKESGGNKSVFADVDQRPKAWKDIWSAGQGVGVITDIPSTRTLVDRLEGEYRHACATQTSFYNNK